MGWKFLLTEKKNSLRNVPGVLKTQKKIGGGGGNVPGVLKRMHKSHEIMQILVHKHYSYIYNYCQRCSISSSDFINNFFDQQWVYENKQCMKTYSNDGIINTAFV